MNHRLSGTAAALALLALSPAAFSADPDGAAALQLPAAAPAPLAQAARDRDHAQFNALMAHKADVKQAEGDGTTALHWAVRWDDLDEARALLKAKANPNAATRLGATPLYLAAINGNPAMIKLLLSAGADANGAVLSNSETPLMHAARSGNTESVQLLLKAGANVNAAESYHQTTALMWAAERSNTAVVRLLLASGADPAATSKVSPVGSSGANPPKGAAVEDDPNLAKPPQAEDTASGGGSDGGARKGGGRVAAAEEDPDRGPPLQADAPAAGATPARAAGDAPAAAKQSGKAEPAGDDPNQAKSLKLADATSTGAAPAAAPRPPKGGRAQLNRVQGGLTALVLAARQNALESAEALLNAGAPVNQPSGDGSTALLVAVQNINLKMARMLLDHGADPSLANKKGWTPLYLAVKDRSLEVGTMPAPAIDRDGLFDLIKLLIDKGAQVNARIGADTEMRNSIKATWLNEAGATPFLRASLCGDVAVMKLLLEHGADPKIPTADGTTALAALAGVGYTKGFMEDIDGPAASLEALKMLVDAGIDVNAANKDKVTALHGAAHKNFVAAIQMLVDHGGDLTAVSQRRGTFERSKEFKGNTVLDWAYGVQTGGESSVYHPEAVQLVEKLLKERHLPLTRFESTDGGIGATVN